jgi:pyruvate decarboxylase
MYHEMAKHISAATVVLDNPNTASTDIDRVLVTMLHESRSIYIGVQVDMSHLECDGHFLSTPLQTALLPNDAVLERKVVAEIRLRLERSENPVIIADRNAIHNDLGEVSGKLSIVTRLPTSTTCIDKETLDKI